MASASSSAAPLVAAADRQPTALLLVFTAAAVAVTVFFCCADAVLSPRARTIEHGDLAAAAAAAAALPPRPRRAKRTLFWIGVSRLLFAALLVAALLPAAVVVRRFYRHPLAYLAPEPSVRWVHALVRAALARHAADYPDTAADLARAPFGLSSRMLTPDSSNPAQAWTWRFVLAFLALVCAVGALLHLIPSRLAARKFVAPVLLIQPVLWLLFAVPAAYVRPSSLPFDSSPITTKWLDYQYADHPARVDENRFLYNWYFTLDSKTVHPLPDLPNITRSFCSEFTALLPSAPQPTSARQTTLTPVTTTLASHLLIVYTVGKPIGPDHYRAISYTCVAVMLAAPVLVAQTLRSYILYPLLAFWLFIFVLFALLATPSVIRPIAAPFDTPQLITFCGKFYNIHVVDPTTKFIIRADIAIFALTIFAAMIHGYRWVKLAEDSVITALHAPSLQPEPAPLLDQQLHHSPPSPKPEA